MNRSEPRALIFISAFGAFLGGAPVNAASLTVTEATIQGGALVIQGTTPNAGQQVTLKEDNFTATSNGQRAFTIRDFGYVPKDCIVNVSASPGGSASAVVSHCGPAVIATRGEWTATRKYATNDLVTLSGSTWRSTTESQNVRPSAGSNAWRLFAAKGAIGPSGDQGSDGEQGLKGQRGAKGITGEDGLPGEDGNPGEKGDTGSSGFFAPAQVLNGPGGGLSASDVSLRFIGPTAGYAISAGRRIIASASVPAYSTTGTVINYGICYRSLSAAPGTLPTIIGGTHLGHLFTVPNYQVLSSNGTVVPASAGNYEIGFCFQQSSNAGDITFDYVNGFVEIF